MNIEEIRKVFTRKEFEKELENNEYGFLGNYSCPDDIGLSEPTTCNYKCKTICSCKKCWLEAIKNVKFKGEEMDKYKYKYKCIKDFKMYDGTIAFTKGKIYEATNSDDGYVSFAKNNRGEKCHWVTKEALEKYFEKVEKIQINQELWNEFLKGKAAVNCETDKEAQEFLIHCKKNNLNWCEGDEIEINDTEWFNCKSDTCYSLTPKLEYSRKNYYKEKGYKIITYKELTIPTAKEECNSGEEKKAYKGWEILKMIDEEELKEGQELNIYYKNTKQTDIIAKLLNKGLYIICKNKADRIIEFDELLTIKFEPIEKQYMTFDEARKIGIPKHIKGGYDTPLDSIPSEVTPKDCENAMEKFIKAMDEKVWYVEEKE